MVPDRFNELLCSDVISFFQNDFGSLWAWKAREGNWDQPLANTIVFVLCLSFLELSRALLSHALYFFIDGRKRPFVPILSAYEMRECQPGSHETITLSIKHWTSQREIWKLRIYLACLQAQNFFGRDNPCYGQSIHKPGRVKLVRAQNGSWLFEAKIILIVLWVWPIVSI